MKTKRPSTDSHNYLPKVQKVMEGFIRRGMIVGCDVHHDEWCDHYNERGFCNCDPDICVIELPDGGAIEEWVTKTLNEYKNR